MAIVRTVCRLMERVAPLKLAEKWDNVGLLLESPIVRPNANRILLTIDLTTEVAEEAISTPTCFIISYHPTIFKPLSSLTLANPLQKSLLRCAAAGISVYCPHTSLDSVHGGINDWLADGCRTDPVSGQLFPGTIAFIGESFEGLGGQGRVVTYDKPISMKTLEASIKQWLDLQYLQVAYPAGVDPEAAIVRSVGIGAGSAGSLVAASKADVWLTGEMQHHEVLAAVAAGHGVILCGHTNTERGYLSKLATNLGLAIIREETEGASGEVLKVLRALEIHVSTRDRHPLQIV